MKNVTKQMALVLAVVMAFSIMVTPAKAAGSENTGYPIADAEPRNMPTPYACYVHIREASNDLYYRDY